VADESVTSQTSLRALDDKQRVSVIVCSYTEERIEQLVQCLGSLDAQTRHPDEILLVIDHNPRLLQQARTQFSGLRILENDRSRGASGARNCGVAHARGDIVAFLDDDTSADPDWLEELIQPYEDRTVLGTTGRVLPRWPDRRPSWFPPEFDWVVGCSYRGMPENTAPVRNLWGPMSLRRAAIEEVGGFNEAIGLVKRNGLGCEETELSIRIRARYPGEVLLYVPAARTTHHLDAPRTARRYFVRRCYGEGLSKAAVAASVGADRALMTERTYTARVLPAGVARGLKEMVFGHLSGLGTATMIVLGLATTTAGYLSGRLTALQFRRRGPRAVEQLSSSPSHDVDPHIFT
jgi:GT2 family glycosyltransferase